MTLVRLGPSLPAHVEARSAQKRHRMTNEAIVRIMAIPECSALLFKNVVNPPMVPQSRNLDIFRCDKRQQCNSKNHRSISLIEDRFIETVQAAPAVRHLIA